MLSSHTRHPVERSLDSVKSQVVEKSAPEPHLACPPRTFFGLLTLNFGSMHNFDIQLDLCL